MVETGRLKTVRLFITLILVTSFACAGIAEEDYSVSFDDSGNEFITPSTVERLISLESLADNDSEEIKKLKKAAAAPETPEKLRELSYSEFYQVRGAVAANSNTPVMILARLSKDKDYRVRRAVAKNPLTPVKVLIKLSRDPAFTVRGEVARHADAPEEVLRELIKEHHALVRSHLALNPNLPLELQYILAGDVTKWSSNDDYDFQHVCQGLVNNKDTDPHVLKIVHMSDGLRKLYKRYWKQENSLREKNIEDDYGGRYSVKEKAWRALFSIENKLKEKKKQTLKKIRENLKLVSSAYPDFQLLKEYLNYFKEIKEKNQFKYEGYHPPVYEGQDKKYYH
ncbi:MAG: hypothetical protein ACE5GM_03485 [bacterium]